MSVLEIVQAVVTIAVVPPVLGLVLYMQNRQLGMKDELLRLREKEKDIEIANLQGKCARLEDEVSALRQNAAPEVYVWAKRTIAALQEVLRENRSYTEQEKERYEAEIAVLRRKIQAADLAEEYFRGADYRYDLEVEKELERQRGQR